MNKNITYKANISTELSCYERKNTGDSKERENQVEELTQNRKKLQDLRAVMKNIKSEINQCILVLQREIGNEIDMPTMLKAGCGPGNQKRMQEIINLRLKLTAMKSKFLEPSHKFYYRGPFKPSKKFDIKMLPQKQNNLYLQVLEKDKIEFLHRNETLPKLQKLFNDLRLMYKASTLRTRSLKEKIKLTSKDIQEAKLKTSNRAKIIEYMVNHQNLMQLMLDPKTLQLSTNLPLLNKPKLEVSIEEVPDVYKYKTLYEKSEKENLYFAEKISSLVGKMDANIRHLIETEKLCIKNRYQNDLLMNLEANDKSIEKKNSKKKEVTEETTEEMKLAIAFEENKWLRDVLLSPVFSYCDDFNLVTTSVGKLTAEFIIEFEMIRNLYIMK